MATPDNTLSLATCDTRLAAERVARRVAAASSQCAGVRVYGSAFKKNATQINILWDMGNANGM